MKSAERIEKRQETDTIELIDDIRYYLDERFRMRVDDMGMYEEGEDESGEGKVDRAEKPDQPDEAKKEKENEELDNTDPGQNRETGGNKESAAPQEEHNLNTEATSLYDSLLGQIDELLGNYPSLFVLQGRRCMLIYFPPLR